MMTFKLFHYNGSWDPPSHPLIGRLVGFNSKRPSSLKLAYCPNCQANHWRKSRSMVRPWTGFCLHTLSLYLSLPLSLSVFQPLSSVSPVTGCYQLLLILLSWLSCLPPWLLMSCVQEGKTAPSLYLSSLSRCVFLSFCMSPSFSFYLSLLKLLSLQKDTSFTYPKPSFSPSLSLSPPNESTPGLPQLFSFTTLY